MSHKSINNQTMSAKASLLPGNVSELERDLDVAIARIEELSIPISELWDPWHCPLDALPFLAWALSVDQWRSDWSATVKRQVVAGSIDVHRIKGTRTAIELALADLGVTVDLVEWFEAQPMAVPYTFDITAWVNQNLTVGAPSILGPELYQQLLPPWSMLKIPVRGLRLKLGLNLAPMPLARVRCSRASGDCSSRYPSGASATGGSVSHDHGNGWDRGRCESTFDSVYY